MIRDNNFYTKHGWMKNKLGLKGYDLDVFAIIYSFSQIDNQYFTGSIGYISDWLDCSRKTVERSLKKLVLKNYIIKEVTKGGQPNRYKANLVLIDYDIQSHIMRHTVALVCDTQSHNNKKNNKKNNISANALKYNSFPQNTYDFASLEKEFLANQ